MINGRLALVLEREYGYIIWYGVGYYRVAEPEAVEPKLFGDRPGAEAENKFK